MPFVELARSPLAPGVTPVRIHVRDAGAGRPIVFLHGGWGYGIYPVDRQIAALAGGGRMVIPDRSGYGGSSEIESLSPDFHRRAMDETRAVVDALGLERPILWGHSDGAIIALLLALEVPDRIGGVIAEATHFYRRKPRSRAFFEAVAANPRTLGDSVTSALARDHGPRWPHVLERHARAWLQIADEAAVDDEDFYAGRLGEVAVPVLVIHGARDPRTEPGEIEALEHALEKCPGRRQFVILAEGGHSPHSEPATADNVTRIAAAFVDRASGAGSREKPAPPAAPAGSAQ